LLHSGGQRASHRARLLFPTSGGVSFAPSTTRRRGYQTKAPGWPSVADGRAEDGARIKMRGQRGQRPRAAGRAGNTRNRRRGRAGRYQAVGPGKGLKEVLVVITSFTTRRRPWQRTGARHRMKLNVQIPIQTAPCVSATSRRYRVGRVRRFGGARNGGGPPMIDE